MAGEPAQRMFLMRDSQQPSPCNLQLIDVEYDRFVCEGRLDTLTLFAFFPALIVGDIWAMPSVGLNVGLWWVAATLVVAIYFSYPFVGFYLGRQRLRAILAGAFAWQVTSLVVVAAYLINVSLYVLTHTAIRLRNDVTLSPLVVLHFLYLAAFIPVNEELAFQGYLQTRLRRLGAFPAMVTTTLLFVTIHVTTLTHFPSMTDMEHLLIVYFPPLFVLAIVRQSTGSLLAAIAVHILYNATIYFTAAVG